ncbi:MAG: TonB-dependent receptor plug domain-containing protein [Flavobacteriaceae bacterium]|nr:TonB-dependent receptor plug domain-containing protein [Flavobacteriaceae bacterium]MDG2350779.1 TonB-dependent receptor plug domain-containing protein [Flavobacteriaceae bacterium]
MNFRDKDSRKVIRVVHGQYILIMKARDYLVKVLCCAYCSMGTAQVLFDSINNQLLEEVVITDSRFNLKRENSGKIITVITQQDLNNQKGMTVADIINTVVGFEINGSKSNSGQNLSYFVRGGRNRQVLILIDGIAMTDASQISNDYDLRLLNIEQVERIEILKGASSTLYGSGAATATINIKLKTPSDRRFSLHLNSTMGSNRTTEGKNYDVHDFRNHVSLTGTLDNFQYLISFGNQYADGFSAVTSGKEPDVFNAYNGMFKIGYNLSDNFKLNVFGSQDKFKADFDDGFNKKDADNRLISFQNRVGFSSIFKYNKGSITVNSAVNETKRHVQSSFPTRFEANNFFIDIFNRYQIDDAFYTVAGVQIQSSSMNNDFIPFGSTEFQENINSDASNFQLFDSYVNTVFQSQFGLNINLGIRLNTHSDYGTHLVYNFNPAIKKDINFGYIKVLGSVSSAYITPSLYQLYDPTYGNVTLLPEQNSTTELGVELGIQSRGILSFVYFKRTETNFIDFMDLGDYVFQYTNVSNEFVTKGFEFVGDYKFSNKLRADLNATFVDLKNQVSLRIPKFKLNGSLSYQMTKSSFVSVSYQYNDTRNDSIYNSETFANDNIRLKSYHLLNLYFSHKINKDKITLFGKLYNAINEDYQEIFGYSTRGRNVHFGFYVTL